MAVISMMEWPIPLGEEIQRDAFVERIDGVAVAQALGDTMRAGGDVCLLHHGDHTPPGCGARPGPQRLIEFAFTPSSLDFFEAVHHVERVQQGGGTGMARYTPLRRFLRLSTMITWSAKPTRLGVTWRASEIRHPV